MTVENSEQSYERILGDKKYGFENISHNSNAVGAEYPHQTLNTASPEHTMEFPSAREVRNQSCIPIGSRHQFEGTGPQTVSATPARDKISTLTSLTLNQQVAPHISQGQIEDSGIAQRTWAPESDHCLLIKSARRESTATPKELEQRRPNSRPTFQSKQSHTPLVAPGNKQIRLDRTFPLLLFRKLDVVLKY
jgi:hypothetical protein